MLKIVDKGKQMKRYVIDVNVNDAWLKHGIIMTVTSYPQWFDKLLGRKVSTVQYFSDLGGHWLDKKGNEPNMFLVVWLMNQYRFHKIKKDLPT